MFPLLKSLDKQGNATPSAAADTHLARTAVDIAAHTAVEDTVVEHIAVVRIAADIVVAGTDPVDTVAADIVPAASLAQQHQSSYHSSDKIAHQERPACHNPYKKQVRVFEVSQVARLEPSRNAYKRLHPE